MNSTLKNSYFLMRHGRSEANEQGLVVSHYDHGGSAFGLTDEGREQVRQALTQQHILNHETVIISSDFLRTRETAEMAAEILHTPPPQTSKLLRERGFGLCELKSDSFYKKVWEEDEKRLSTMGAESPAEVLDRFRRLVKKTEAQYRGKQILLISHGDILQIALTWGAAISPYRHRSLRHLDTAEIRLFPVPREWKL